MGVLVIKATTGDAYPMSIEVFRPVPMHFSYSKAEGYSLVPDRRGLEQSRWLEEAPKPN